VTDRDDVRCSTTSLTQPCLFLYDVDTAGSVRVAAAAAAEHVSFAAVLGFIYTAAAVLVRGAQVGGSSTSTSSKRGHAVESCVASMCIMAAEDACYVICRCLS
jgi:hypothetical protein